MKTFAGYIRVSTVRQGEHGVSLQAQRDAITGYASRNSLSVSSWFEERVTAAKRGRPVFSDMIRLLKQRKLQGVVMHKIDRSARNLRDWADLGELIDSGVEVHFAGDSLDLHTRGGRLSADIQAVVAADYIRNLREEAKKGLYGRLKQGIYPFGAPLGYLNKGGGKVNEPDPERAPLVRKAFELYSTGTFTLESLVEEMWRRGLRTREKKKVGITRFSSILNDPFYTGLIRIKCNGETFAGVHSPLITRSIFERVHAVLAGNHTGWVQRREFLFSKMFTCNHCGRSLIPETQKGFVYYRCHTKACPTRGVREESLDNAILEVLDPLTLSKDEQTVIKGEIESMRENWINDMESQIGALKLRQSKLRDRLDRLTDAYLDQCIDRDLFEQRKAGLLTEQLHVVEQIASLGKAGGQIVDRVQEFVELASTAQQTYKIGNRDQKRRILEITTSNRTVDGKNVSVGLSNAFEEVKNRPPFPLCGDHRNTPRTFVQKLTSWFASNPQWRNPLKETEEEE